MAKKTTESAAKALKKIMAELNDGVIKDYEMPTLCNIETAKETGFAVILTLSTKFEYTNKVLDNWKNRLSADDYVITVRRNQLRVRYNVMFEKEKETMTEYKIQGWVARDECSDICSCGETNLFVSQLKPNRLADADTSPGFGMWSNRGEYMALPADMFPQLTYKDDPVEVEIIIKTKEE